jgi:hypothetical protein
LLALVLQLWIVWLGIIKERHWDSLREQARMETERAQVEAARANEAAGKAQERAAAFEVEAAKASAEIAEARKQTAAWKMIGVAPQEGRP